MMPLIRHPVQDFLGDFAIFPDRARGFEHRQDRLEWIAMDTGYAVDFLDAASGVLVHPVTSSGPISTRLGDVLLADQAVDYAQAVGDPWGLP